MIVKEDQESFKKLVINLDINVQKLKLIYIINDYKLINMIEDNRKYYKPINPTNSVLNCKICCNLAVDPIECPKCE